MCRSKRILPILWKRKTRQFYSVSATNYIRVRLV